MTESRKPVDVATALPRRGRATISIAPPNMLARTLSLTGRLDMLRA